MKTRTAVIANGLSGALWLLAFPPLSWYWLGLIFLVPHFIFLLRETGFVRLLCGVALFRGILLAGLIPGFFEPLFYLTTLLLFAGIVPALLLLKRLVRVLPAEAGRSPIVAVVVTAGCYLAFEWVQARYSLLPLFAMTSGCILGRSPLVGLARFGGVMGLSAFVVVINAVLAGAWVGETRGRSRRTVLRRLAAAVTLAGVLLGAGGLLSQRVLAQNRAHYERRSRLVHVAAVSVGEAFAEETQAPDVVDAYTTDVIRQTVAGYVQWLKDALRQGAQQPDLIVFPEDMIDFEFWRVPDPQALKMLTITNGGPAIALYRTVARELHSSLLFVLTTLERGGRFNSALLLDSAGELGPIYHKNTLALAIESWPFGRFHPFYFDWWMDEEAQSESPIYNPEYRYRRGDAATLFRLRQGLTFGTLICLEIHYPHRARDMVRLGAQALFNTSSNMSIGRGLRTYIDGTLNLRRIEAVWLGVPIVFCGRRDYAGIVFPDGTADISSLPDAKTATVYRGSIRY